MPRGGARPGAGRKPKTPKADAPAMAKGGFTAADGRKTADAPANWPFGREPEAEAPPQNPGPKLSFSTPMEYWEHVLADPEATPSAKHAAAYSLAPYVHPRLAPIAKKDEAADKAKKAAKGRFGATRAPMLATANGKAV